MVSGQRIVVYALRSPMSDYQAGSAQPLLQLSGGALAARKYGHVTGLFDVLMRPVWYIRIIIDK